MTHDQPELKSKADADLERELRAGRKFSLADAIGRLAGPGMMKGVSPIGRNDQAVAEVQEYLRQHLADAGGVLSGTLLRQVSQSETFLAALDQPLVALAGHVRRILTSEYALTELVRQADVEWGRMFGERPYFESDGCAPSPDDPYTVESVRRALTLLADGLTAGGV